MIFEIIRDFQGHPTVSWLIATDSKAWGFNSAERSGGSVFKHCRGGPILASNDQVPPARGRGRTGRRRASGTPNIDKIGH